MIASIPETGTESKLLTLLSQIGSDLRTKLGIGDIEGTEVTKIAATIPRIRLRPDSIPKDCQSCASGIREAPATIL